MRNHNASSRSVAIVAATCVLAWAGVSAAQEERGRPPEGGFMGHDANGDGVVSREEFPGPDAHFTHLDANGDGVVNESEAPKGPPPGRDGSEEGGAPGGGARFIDRLDTNGDDRVSEAEFDGPDDHFGHLDRDGDGYISEDEAPTGPPPRREGSGSNGGRGRRR